MNSIRIVFRRSLRTLVKKKIRRYSSNNMGYENIGAVFVDNA